MKASKAVVSIVLQVIAGLLIGGVFILAFNGGRMVRFVHEKHIQIGTLLGSHAVIAILAASVLGVFLLSLLFGASKTSGRIQLYFYRVSLCLQQDFSKLVFLERWTTDAQILWEALRGFLATFFTAVFYTARVVLRPIGTFLNCLYTPVKYGAVVEERLKPKQ